MDGSDVSEWSGVVCPQVENMDEVERAFVHVDYERRESPEHKLDWSMS